MSDCSSLIIISIKWAFSMMTNAFFAIEFYVQKSEHGHKYLWKASHLALWCHPGHPRTIDEATHIIANWLRSFWMKYSMRDAIICNSGIFYFLGSFEWLLFLLHLQSRVLLWSTLPVAIFPLKSSPLHSPQKTILGSSSNLNAVMLTPLNIS